MGRGTRQVFELVREGTPFVDPHDPLPADLDGLVELIRSNVFVEPERPLAADSAG
jgi:hypothetical protein